jgi:hypothetical protein
MTIAPPPKTVPSFCLGSGCLGFAIKRHLGTINHLPHHIPAYSDFAAEFSGLDLQGVGGGDKNNSVCIVFPIEAEG